MTNKPSLYSNPVDFSSILVVGKQPNSTYDLYLAPRFSDAATEKLKHHDPFKSALSRSEVEPDQCLVILNRYVTRDTLRWLERHKARLGGILWMVDDDYKAMVFGRSITTLNKVRPALTLLAQRRLKRLVDHLIVSTERLADLYADWPVIVMPPVAEIPEQGRPVNPNQLYYFAKMHGPEHEFLWPVVSTLMRNNPQARFMVTANGAWASKWKQLDGVTVLSEIPYIDYQGFLRDLDCGGLFLVPLTDSTLNASRSEAKLIEVAQTGSALLVANHPAYQNYIMSLENEDELALQPDAKNWLLATERMMSNSDLLQHSQAHIERYIRNRFDNRIMIV